MLEPFYLCTNTRVHSPSFQPLSGRQVILLDIAIRLALHEGELVLVGT